MNGKCDTCPHVYKTQELYEYHQSIHEFLAYTIEYSSPFFRTKSFTDTITNPILSINTKLRLLSYKKKFLDVPMENDGVIMTPANIFNWLCDQRSPIFVGTSPLIQHGFNKKCGLCKRVFTTKRSYKYDKKLHKYLDLNIDLWIVLKSTNDNPVYFSKKLAKKYIKFLKELGVEDINNDVNIFCESLDSDKRIKEYIPEFARRLSIVPRFDWDE